MHTSGRAVLDDLDWNDRPWSGIQAYCDSKLLVTTLSAAVARHWPDVTATPSTPAGCPPVWAAPPPPTTSPSATHANWLATSDDPGHRAVLVPPTHPNTRPAVNDTAFQEALLDDSTASPAGP